MILHHDTGRQSNKNEFIAHVTCSIFGDDIDHDFWTKYFGIEPDIAVIKGKSFKTPSGRMSSQLGRTGVWGCSSKIAVRDQMLDPHLKHLILRLGLPREDLPNMLQKSRGEMRFLCFWSNYSGDRIPKIDLKLRKIIESSGGFIEIDEYPQKHKILDADGKQKMFGFDPISFSEK